MSAETVKYSIRKLLNPPAQLLAALGVSPGAVTGAGLILSAAAAVVLAAGSFAAGAIVLILSGLCDMLDGMVARGSGKAGGFGAVADSVSDRYADAFVLLGLFYYYGLGEGAVSSGDSQRPAIAAYLALAAIVGSFMVSYVRARAEGMGLECKIGLLERPWRMVLLTIGAFLGPGVMAFVLWPLALLTHWTAMQRVLEVRKQFARRGGEAAGRAKAGSGASGADSGRGKGARDRGPQPTPEVPGRARGVGTPSEAKAPERAIGADSQGEHSGRGAVGARPYSGLFVTLEGVEGSGKTTQAGMAADALRAAGRDVVETREPGGTAAGESIRELLLGSAGPAIGAETELLLYMADRAQHVRDVISPALASGAVVLCDRFSDATLAYQSGGRGLSAEAVRALDLVATGGMRPDLTLLLDLPEDQGLARAGGRAGAPDRMERESAPFHREVRQAYLDIASKEPDRVKVIDATGSPQAVAEKILSLIEEALKR